MSPLPHLLVLGNAGCPRVAGLERAAAELGLPRPRLVPWIDLIEGRLSLAREVREGTVVRLESPGRDFEVERALIVAGAPAPSGSDRPAVPGPPVSPACAAVRLEPDRGRILYPRQWYAGFRRVLDTVRAQLAQAPSHRAMQDPAEVALMFDKPACHARLAAAGLPVPEALSGVTCFDTLLEAMAARRVSQVFVKLAHGSGGAGIVAYRTDGRRHRAITTVEVVRRGDRIDLYSTRRLRLLDDRAAIATVVDALAPHGIHVERWIPKAFLDGRAFDLRVVVVAGRARHVVPRLGRSPITNLHLLNARGDPERARALLGRRRWEAAMTTCERVLSVFPGALYAGVDLAVASGLASHAVLEVNAFGDQLPGITQDGEDAYTAEIRALREAIETAGPGGGR